MPGVSKLNKVTLFLHLAASPDSVCCFVLLANGQWLTANGCLVVNFCLFSKILLGHTCLSKIVLYFCVARENLRPRHAVNFSMPCAWRGVKKFCVGSALRAVQCHG